MLRSSVPRAGLVAGALVLFPLAACQADRVAGVEVADRLLIPASTSLTVGSARQLEARVVRRGRDTIAADDIIWRTTDTAVARIVANRTLVAVRVGETSLIGAWRGTQDTTAVTVSARVAAVFISPQELVLRELESATVTATPRDADGAPITGRPVTWISTDTNVARVADGRVTAKVEGTTTVIATVEGISGAETVRVLPAAVASLTLQLNSPTINAGQPVQAVAIPRDATGRGLVNRVVTFRTSNAAVATVDANGLVRGVDAGTVDIIATSEGQTASAPLTVLPAVVASVALTPASANLSLAQSLRFVATARDESGREIAGRAIRWSSSSPTVATVADDGTVTARAIGGASITATIDGQTATAPVNVVPSGEAAPVVTPATLGIIAGQSAVLTAVLRDQAGNTIPATFTWSSANTSIATVAADGRVTGVAPGTTTITASTDGKSAAATVTVTPVPVASVVVTPPSLSLVVAQTATVSASCRDAAGNELAGRSATWGSNATSVATVDALGTVRGVGPGTTTLVATCEGRTANVPVTVAAAPVASVQVLPGSASLQINGSTQFVAVARDAAGNVLQGRAFAWQSSAPTVATVADGRVTALDAGTALVVASTEGRADTATVTVAAPPPPPPPSGTSGIVGDTIFYDGFEGGSLALWQDGVDPARHRIVSDPALVATGARALEVTYPAGGNGGWLTRFFMPGYDSVLVRYRVRLAQNFNVGTKFVALNGSRIDNQWSAFGKAGVCPNGTDFFGAYLVTENGGTAGSTPPLRFYTYYPGMRREPDGTTCYGRFGDGTERYIAPLAISLGEWHTLELWVRLNAPGALNGSQRFWVDGQLRGEWSGISFRSTADLRLNSVQLSFNANSSPSQETRLWVDDVVVIAPRGGNGGSATPPAAPTNLGATAVSANRIDLRWTDNASDETGHIVERCTGSGCTAWEDVARLAAGVTTWASTGLAAGTPYSFRVRAVNPAGASAPSNTATATTVVIPPPTGSGWPNVPPELPLMRDNPWNALSGNGWNFMKTEGDARIVQDPTAPTGAGAVLELIYPRGFVGGTAPAQLWTGLNSATSSTGRPREMYVGMWWKMGAPDWQGHGTGVNKVQYLFTASNTNTIITAYGPVTGPWRIINSSYLSGGIRMMEPNVAQVPIYANTWYRIEWYVRYPSTPGGSDGRIRWWVNGQLVGDYAETFPNDAGFIEYKLGSVWGGLGSMKAQEEYMRFDQTVLYGR